MNNQQQPPAHPKKPPSKGKDLAKSNPFLNGGKDMQKLKQAGKKRKSPSKSPPEISKKLKLSPDQESKQKINLKSQLASMKCQLDAVQHQIEALLKSKSSSKKKLTRKSEPEKVVRKVEGKTGKGRGWGHLPQEILVKILKELVHLEGGCLPCLVRTSSVCKSWHSASCIKTLWTKVDLRRTKELFRLERNLNYLLVNKFPHVQELNVTGWLVNPKMVEDIVNVAGKNLKSISFGNCGRLAGSDLKVIAEGCLYLEKLDLSGVSPTACNVKSAVSGPALESALPVIGSKLKCLSLANNCLGSVQLVIDLLAAHCPELTSLDISSVSTPRPAPLKLEQFTQSCLKLTILRLTNTQLHLDLNEKITSVGLTNLKELSIAVDVKKPGVWQGFSEGELMKLTRGAGQLKLLDLRGCSNIDESAVVRVGAEKLEHLFLGGCTACLKSNPELLIQKWSKTLIELDLSLSQSNLKEALQHFNEESPLKILNVQSSAVELDSIKQVLKCVKLEWLDLSGCRGLPRGLKRVYTDLKQINELKSSIC